ncbi:MobA/MobL family protein [Lachnospiraceae bacterium 48-42]
MIHLNAKIISKGGEKPQSAVASAAYRSGTKIYCEYDGEIKDFSRKGHVIYSEILLPEYAPKEFADRSVLWNAVENFEKGSRAQLSREIEFSLPYELDVDERLKAAKTLAGFFRDKGMVFCPPEIRDKSIENRDKNLDKRESKEQGQFLREKGTLPRPYGKYGNVILTDRELETLKNDFPADYLSMIEHLSEYMEYSGKTYKNHLATMECWKRADLKKERETGRGYTYNGSFKEGDSL